MIGRTLSHFKITAKLGEGGMGQVYRAQDTTLGREVALKILPPELAGSRERLERFQSEAKTLAALDHPNIVTIYTVEEDEDVHFLTMQLVKGKPLSQLIPKGGLRLESFFEIAIPLSDALAAAHEENVIHRDLKPANVMVGEDGRVRVVDFGLAKLRHEVQAMVETELPTEPLTQEGRIVGTMPYMSPEQLEGREVDARSDIFSLGVMLYEMATGERPFKGDTSVSLISSIVKDAPSAVDGVRKELPHHLGRVIARCLEKHPQRRYQSAIDVRNELEDLRAELVSAKVMGTAESPTIRRPARPRVAVAMAAVAVILAVAAVIWTSWPTDPGDESPHSTVSRPPRLVVLPFDNLGDPGDEYFADGLTEELISRLAGVSGLRVISRTTAMQYKENRPTLKQIGEELEADYVLEGSVRWGRAPGGDGRVRITPQLIRVADDTHLWAKSYDRQIEDVFEVQAEIADKTIGHLGITLQAAERLAVERRPTDNLAAYEAYLRGQSYQQSYTEGDSRLSIQMFQRAVEEDATFIEAYVGLCLSHSMMFHMGYDRSEERRALARRAADRAIELDPDSPLGHKALGSYFYYVDRDYGRAEKELILAQKGLPSDNELLLTRGYVQRRRGDWAKSLASLDEVIEMDPRSYEAYYNQSWSLVYLRRYKDAEVYIDEAMKLRPDLVRPYRIKVMNIWLWKGDLRESRKVLEGMPQSPRQQLTWVRQELYERDYAAALEQLLAEPDEVFLHVGWLLPKAFLIGWLSQLQNEPEQAIRAFNDSEDLLEQRLLDSDDFRLHSALGLTLAALGRKDEAIREGQKAVSIYPLTGDAFEGSDVLIHLAWLYTIAGDYDAAIDELDRLLAIPSLLSVPLLKIDPRWDPLRDHPRFQALLEKYGQEVG